MHSSSLKFYDLAAIRPELASQDVIALRQLCRFRFSMVDTIVDLKRKVIAVLDMLFPEYEKLFSDLFGATSSELLNGIHHARRNPGVDTDKLAAFIAKHSRNRLGWDKAEELQAAAKSSFDIDFALDAYRFQLRILLKQIRFSEEQLALIEKIGDISRFTATGAIARKLTYIIHAVL